ncbi:MAG: TRAP transporter TAXI family solute receptor [Pirellulaceae bacterium]|jgi:TRAP transporter TAXI family solute receptor
MPGPSLLAVPLTLRCTLNFTISRLVLNHLFARPNVTGNKSSETLSTETLSTKKRRSLGLWLPAIIVSISALLATPWLLGPRVPDKIVIATGSEEGAYFAFANRYREILAKEGIAVEVRPTAGSIENNQLLRSDDQISLALLQGGTATPTGDDELESLAALYLEPVWVFVRSEEPIDDLESLRGKRISVGAKGSGTREIALKLLDENAIAGETSNDDTELLAWNTAATIAGLKSGKIDAAFFVTSASTSYVHDLLQTDGMELVNFRRAAAYQRKYKFLSSVTFPEGLSDFDRNIPSRDIVLLAPAANLVARADLHHALIPLLLQTVEEVHLEGGLLASSERFPSPNFVDYPLNTDARRYFRAGPSIFYRFLPFWLAAWLDRVKLVLLPMCTLLIPLLKVAPPVYRWRIRSKIYRWYKVLRDVDQKRRDAHPSTDFQEEILNIKNLEKELAEVTVPLSYMEEFYNLRLHVAFVLKLLIEHDAQSEGESGDSHSGESENRLRIVG